MIPERELAEQASLCPRCKANVHPLANQCPACGEYFPNVLQRTGDVAGGALCGITRGVSLAGLLAAGIAVWQLATTEFSVGSVVLLVIGAIVFFVAATIAARLDQRTYHRDDRGS